MHLTETMYLDCAPEVVFPLVADLDRYPGWMRLVHQAEPEPGSDPPAWSCELRAKVGPFARSKRLRMIRSEFEQDRHVAFERHETDGRSHARWAMQVTTTPANRDEVDASTTTSVDETGTSESESARSGDSGLNGDHNPDLNHHDHDDRDAEPHRAADSGGDTATETSHKTGHKTGTKLTIVLIYGGQLWTGGLLDRILDDEVQRGRAGLQRKIDALKADTSA